MDPDKMNRLSIFMCEDGISFKPRAKILLRFFYLIGTRKLEVIETIT